MACAESSGCLGLQIEGEIEGAAVVEDDGVVRVEGEGPVIGLQRLVEPPLVPVGDAEVVPGFRVEVDEGQRLVEEVDRLIEAAASIRKMPRAVMIRKLAGLFP